VIRVVLGMLALLYPHAAFAQQPLLLEEVLQSSARHSPAIIEAINKEQAAQGKQLSAYGAFDTVVDIDMKSRALGYYDGTFIDGDITRPLTTNGGKVYGGYRVSRGEFPVYDGKAYTNRFGEARVGTVFSLLRDRVTDDRRTQVGLAALDVELARLDRDLVAIDVQRRAIAAYQQWVAAGMRVGLYRDLLGLAAERQTSIERQIQLGARPGILDTENQQNIVRRETLLVGAQRELDTAANALSFYLRNQNGEPYVPSPDRLPTSLPSFDLPQIDALLRNGLSRPEFDAVLVRLDQVEARRRLAENDLKPRLDLQAELSKDVGPVGLGGSTRTPTEGYVGFQFTLPLERRKARGRIAEAEAEARALAARRRLIEDRILVEVNELAIEVRATDKLVALAADETRLAQRMASAERRRFTLGASEVLVVNLREESAADARLRQIEAEYRRASARADLIAAIVDREQLGLEDLPSSVRYNDPEIYCVGC
jgi:outer membrane protein TolC